MRDKEGNRLQNAHLLGFFRRICKLLFYNIKPVFVFDGGSPELKRLTLNERRKRRTGNANNIQKTAEKLLSAQLRLNAIQDSKDSVSKKNKGLWKRAKTDDIVYFDGLNVSSEEQIRLRKRDEYDLPSMSGGIESMISKDDPRLATEDDLRNFIKEFKPEEIDVDSEVFRSLPLATQCEIIGELRIKSRQTSWDRIQEIVNNAPTAMDFSQLQIKYLVKRNDLTQKLINATNNANTDNTTPIRIASERNKKYVLVKNREGNAGWTMSSIDENESNYKKQVSGTRESPVYVDMSPHNDDKNASLEFSKSGLTTDNKNKDFEDHTSLSSEERSGLLMDKDAYVEDNESMDSIIEKFKRLESEQLDDIPNFDTSASMNSDSFYVLWLSRMPPAFQKEYHDHNDMLRKAVYVWNDDELEEQKKSVTKKLGKLKESDKQKVDALNFWQRFLNATFEFRTDRQSNTFFNDQQDLEIGTSNNPIGSEEQKIHARETNYPIQKRAHTIKKLNINFGSLILPINHNVSSYHTSTSLEDSEIVAETSDFEEFEEFDLTKPFDADCQSNSSTINSPLLEQTPNDQIIYSDMGIDLNTDMESFDTDYESQAGAPTNKVTFEIVNSMRNSTDISEEDYIEISSDEDDESKYGLQIESAINNSDEEIPKQLTEEESEFARFLSELKKKDLNSVQLELNTEVQRLNEQQRREKRDADSVTQTMISECQKLLQLFGIPYIIAPMEAEAQCAELLHLGLVDGIVTDDSDVFLFGGSRIYKNMFSQQKYVECYLLQDLEKNMRLDREKLINLAILLGSDYTEGLSGVGVVNAMEILNEFPGEKGLEHFRDWWLEVQNGINKPDNESDFKRKFRKKMKNLILSKNFPSHHVRDAYLRPQVDDSKNEFQWAMPDLDDLRDFLMDNFLWSHEKVDETLVPLMKTLVKRKSEEKNQKVLDDFFDPSIGSSNVYKSHKSARIQRIVDSWKHETFNNENHSNDGNELSQQKKRSQESANVITEQGKSLYKKRKRQKANKKVQ
ncbi:PIN domain-like protein [Rhizophagus irregularis]|uniref:PIN domain-like protein n=3 Tax=Rhizophagus irregularis TaxID=588596 RepID=U9T4Z8_RHIID|nr:hypothetical protein GLOIN_2v1680659 [Rhizophagus irregularis DAOM 181602=DAOM 197198]PKC60854.1 PIN domain-like protein [Rhizophagus irregularis]PKY31769.1 PIN domain-like protein [Rhizophagus irregularis]POG63924.1 hypothetical protein GLOIN_2v1680659 [Rhizophagus irregularis DAOM 181602=DAOM 197198]|eukprot:XP_025170790.1 hypothetical protein GLOIN_2v1680659 [Rhizophagus irregularis DAOM 181602=DAOM 197198]